MNAVTTAESVVETHALEGIDWTVLAQETAINPSTKTDKPLEWAVGFFFGNVELRLELWTVIAGISGFDD